MKDLQVRNILEIIEQINRSHHPTIIAAMSKADREAFNIYDRAEKALQVLTRTAKEKDKEEIIDDRAKLTYFKGKLYLKTAIKNGFLNPEIIA